MCPQPAVNGGREKALHRHRRPWTDCHVARLSRPRKKAGDKNKKLRLCTTRGCHVACEGLPRDPLTEGLN